ncbi:MAG: hypothetical protein NUK65_08970, partial [Firmicutes bacterium]|nr:hypothetical protein [Bacillota bacterium]
MLKKIGNIVFFIIVFTLISMTALSLLRGQPTGAVAVRSWSMEPMITRGDLAIIWPATKKSIFSQDQIIV